MRLPFTVCYTVINRRFVESIYRIQESTLYPFQKEKILVMNTYSFTPKNIRIRRGASLLLGLVLLVLMTATWIAHRTGTAHANGPILVTQQNCSTQPNSQSCDRQDPVQQQCVADAKTIQGESIPAFYQGQQIGVAELRYSPKCDSYWDRVIAYAGSPVVNVSVLQSTLYSENTPQPDGSLQVYTDMVYHHRGSPDTATFEMQPGSLLVTVVLP